MRERAGSTTLCVMRKRNNLLYTSINCGCVSRITHHELRRLASNLRYLDPAVDCFQGNFMAAAVDLALK